ncbi:S8 family serine peptidase [Paenibacillus sp. Y5S-9]|uniref:S8 family peptidase n=1 Tax=Paenibacillus sp. Y5S-9 TaxID=3122489 RepID=UPI0030D1F5AA
MSTFLIIQFSKETDRSFVVLTNQEIEHLDFSSQYEPWGVSYINSKSHFSKHINNKKRIKVAIMDSGVDGTHQDLERVYISHFNAISPQNEAVDRLGHGTAMAGIISANDNGKGIIGISSNVEISSIKVLDDEGKGDLNSFVKGIEWAIKQDVDIINMSFGIKRDDPRLRYAIEEASKNGIILVAAAGNNPAMSTQFPAAYENVISVTAIDHLENSYPYVSLGKIDFSAPGVNILTLQPNNEYRVFDGTSFAAAHVTGIVANLLSSKEYTKNEKITEQIKKELILISKDLGEPGYDPIYGNGSLSFDENK